MSSDFDKAQSLEELVKILNEKAKALNKWKHPCTCPQSIDTADEMNLLAERIDILAEMECKRLSRRVAALDEIARATCEQLAVCWGHGCAEKKSPPRSCQHKYDCKSRKILLKLVKANYSLVLKREWEKLPEEARK